MRSLIPYVLLFSMLVFSRTNAVCQSSVPTAIASDEHTNKQNSTIFERLDSFYTPDSIHSEFIKAESDSNFRYSKYLDFLANFGDTGRYVVVPLEEFRNTFDSKKIVIGLRHDVDLDLNIAHRLARLENNIAVRSSYYILHTAPYYLIDQVNMEVHNEAVLPTLKQMQNEFHHEIGWHNDLLTLQVVYNIDPVSYFNRELQWLRNNGIKLSGTASHGSNFCYTYNYLNYYFFNECKDRIVDKFKNNDSIRIDNKLIVFKHASLKDFGLNYEAYFLNNTKYFSDAKFIEGERWHPGMLDIKSLEPGDRVIVLTHPIYYFPYGSGDTELSSFSIIGQLQSKINRTDQTISVEIPSGTNLRSLVAEINTAPQSSVWINQVRIQSAWSTIDFTHPVRFKIIAEDGLTSTDWDVSVKLIETGFSIFPNPSTGLVTLDFDNLIGLESRLELYNSMGNFIHSETIEQKGSFSLSRNYSNLPAGMYYFRLTNNNRHFVQKLVIN